MKTVRKRSQEQEKRVAKQLGGRVTPASGALWGAKGDVRQDKFLVECKTTEKDYYSLTDKVWNKIRSEAIRDGLRIPLMCIEIQGKSYAIIEKPMVEDYFGNRGIYPTDVEVEARSFRVRQLQDNKPIYYRINTWSLVTLAQIEWEQFLEISDTL